MGIGNVPDDNGELMSKDPMEWAIAICVVLGALALWVEPIAKAFK